MQFLYISIKISKIEIGENKARERNEGIEGGRAERSFAINAATRGS